MKKRGPKIDPRLGKVQRRTVCLDELTVQMAGVFGKNLSDGLRNAVRAAYAEYQRDQPK